VWQNDLGATRSREGHFFFFFAGTFAPALRASDSPIAMACLRLVTFFPELPDRRVPFLRSCIVFSTFLLAADAYFLFFAVAMRRSRSNRDA
jgi:hypothetical protein